MKRSIRRLAVWWSLHRFRLRLLLVYAYIGAVHLVRLVLVLAYVGALGWFAYKGVVELGGSTPTTARRFDANHRLAEGDLRTPRLDALIGRYLREPVEAAKSVTVDMLSEHPLVPVMPTGVRLVVNMSRPLVQSRGLTLGRKVRIQRDGTTLLEAGKVVAAPCDESRCAIVIDVIKLPNNLDATSLVDADVLPAPDNASVGG